jgi:uncharacterized membrane protein required for colicin V production
MLWDGLIVVLILTMILAGWNVGIVNSWRGPIAIVIATLVTQMFYVDFATWIVQQLRVQPVQAVAIGYPLLWCAVDIVCEIVMNIVLPWGSKNRPVFFGRVGGALFGLVRALIIIILPMIALQGPMKVPAPPPDKSPVINPMHSGIDKAGLVGFFNGISKGFYPAVSGMVVSDKEPSFKPNFSGNTAVDEMNSTPKP